MKMTKDKRSILMDLDVITFAQPALDWN